MNLYDRAAPFQGTGFLQNRYGVDQTTVTAVNPTKIYTVGRDPALGNPEENTPTAVFGSLAAAPVDIVDTLASLVPGIKRGATNDAFYDGLGLPGFGQWVRDNKGSVEVASGIVGAVATGWAAEAAAAKLLGSAWFAATGAGRAASPVLNWFANAQRVATAESLAAAKSGKALGWFDGAWLAGGNRTFVTSKVLRGVGSAVIGESAIVAALHNNSFIWSDDMSTNALMAGLGIALPGGAALIGARGQLLREFNSTLYKEAVANAVDPGQYLRLMGETPMSGLGGSKTGRVPVRTAEFTLLQLDHLRVEKEAVRVDLRGAAKTESSAEAKKVLQAITNRGADGVPTTGFASEGTGEGRHLLAAAHEDPTILLGATSVGRLPEKMGLDDFFTYRESEIKTLKASKEPADRLRAKELESETALVLVGKRWVGPKEALEEITYVPQRERFRPTAKGTSELAIKLPHSGKQVFLREDGAMNVDWAKLHTHDQLRILQASHQALTDMKAGTKIVLPAKPTFFQLDFAIEAEKRGATVDYTTRAGLVDGAEAAVRSVQMKSVLADSMATLGMKERRTLNLPLATRMEKLVDPDGAQLKQVMKQSFTPGTRIADLGELRVKVPQVTDIAMDVSHPDRLDGDMFNFSFGTGKDDGWLTPVIGFFKDVPTNHWVKTDLGLMAAERQATSNRAVARKRNAPLASGLMRKVLAHPDFAVVRKIVSLMDNMLPGTKGLTSATLSQFTTQAHRFRNTPELLGAQALRRLVNRNTELHIDDVFKRLSPLLDQLHATSGRTSQLMLNNYMSHAAGWDIKSVVQRPGGNLAFKLDPDSLWNQQRLGRPLQADELMMDERGIEVVMDQLGNNFRIAMEAEYKQLLFERNAIREAMGLEPIKGKNFYVPPISTRGKIIGFTLDAGNRVMPGGTVIASTPEEFKQLSDLAREKAAKIPGARYMAQEQIKRFADIWEQADMDFVNPLQFMDPTTLVARGGPQRGKLLGGLNPLALDDAISGLKRGYEQVGNGVLRNVFDAQLRVARIRSNSMKLTYGENKGAKNVFEVFEETLMGVPAHVNPKGLTKLASEVDDKLDTFIQQVWPGVNVSAVHVKDFFDKVGSRFDRNRVGKMRTLEQLADELGPYMPFADVESYLQYKHGLTPPWKSREIARGVNRFASGIVLRWLEVPHAIMNVAGLITAMPGLLAAKNVPSFGRVGGVPIIDSAKIISRGMKRMFMENNGNITRDWQKMLDDGYTTQDVAELHTQLSLRKGKTSLERFVFGDPAAKSKLARKGIEGWASVIADTSENMGRRLTHFIGLEVADLHGIRGLEARHKFAAQFANDAIANYDPLNRPEIFQSAFGSMYGLFLSYSQNYYQRLFRWVEVGDTKAVGISLATQASMFGMMGMPGARQIADMIGGEEDQDDLLTGIYKRFGPAVGSTVAHGGFNQWTSLFGLPPMALHTRGDASFRHPAMEAAFGKGALPVGLEVMKDLWNGTTGMVANLGNPRYAAEIMARNMPSRMIRGTISTLALGGQEADAYGNLMSENKDAFEAVYRILGVRSSRQQGEIEAYFLNQKGLAIDAAKMDEVRKSSRALIRDGKYDQLPAIFERYVEAGGKPWNYRGWVQNLIKTSGETRGQNQLLQMMKRPGMQDLARRIQLMTDAYD